MSKTFTYPKEWFAEGFDPKKLETGDYWIKLSELMRFMQMSWDEMRRELAAGRMSAHGTPHADGRGYSDVAIHTREVTPWLATKHGMKYWNRRESVSAEH